jgi:phospholipid/cholesterol/gamma-HCH transport system ATP-binding protein
MLLTTTREPEISTTGPDSAIVAPAAVVFERVTLAFDEHVVLRDISFSVPKATMRILLGASGAGKSVLLKLILGLLRPDSGRILVNGQRIDDMRERDLLQVRADIGMLFQENALFDSLTVAENVGYRLYEETDMARDTVRARVEEVLAFIVVRRSAATRGDRTGHGGEARPPTVRRPDERPRPDHRDDRGRRDRQTAGPATRDFDRGHAPDP